MSHFKRFALAALLFAAAGSALSACQSLAGIEDRTYGGDAGATGEGEPSAQCQQYCSLAVEVCGGTDALYADDKTCLGICALLPKGEDIEPTGNTVACRINQLLVAKQVTPGEPATLPDYCAKAGPGGDGTCGTDCESYCLLYQGACQTTQPQLGATQYDQDTCVAKCKGLKDLPTFDSLGNYSGDTLQCRLAHTSSATVAPEEHCVHAQLQAQAQAVPPGPCIDDPAVTKPDCDSYCQLEMTECDGERAVYESLAQCKAVCAALPQGSVADIKENTVGCRKYHSYNALVDPMTHCPHTGPGGDGHCGSPDMPSAETVTGNCESYCILLSKACASTVPGLDVPDTFAGNFKTQAACQQACGNDLDGAAPNSGYSIDPLPEGPTLQCRLLHVSRALVSPTAAINECSAALGGAPCQ
jgi:hypothetical protein